MPVCVKCRKNMDMGYIVLEGNKVHCPECADKHPQVIAAKERAKKIRAARKLEALAVWKQIAGDKNEVQVDGVTVTKEDFINSYTRRGG